MPEELYSGGTLFQGKTILGEVYSGGKLFWGHFIPGENHVGGTLIRGNFIPGGKACVSRHTFGTLLAYSCMIIDESQLATKESGNKSSSTGMMPCHIAASPCYHLMCSIRMDLEAPFT